MSDLGSISCVSKISKSLSLFIERVRLQCRSTRAVWSSLKVSRQNLSTLARKTSKDSTRTGQSRWRWTYLKSTPMFFFSRLFRLLLTTCRLCGAHCPLSNGPSAAAWSHSRVADFMNSYRNAVVSGGGTARARGGRLPRAAFYRGRHCMAKLMNMFVILQVHLDVC